MWEIEIRHEGLNKYRKIRGSDKYVVEQKAVMQQREWDEAWQKKVAREKAAQCIEESKQMAISLTREAEANLDAIDKTLSSYLDKNILGIDWDKLKDFSTFSKKCPLKSLPNKKEAEPIPREPLETDELYKPSFGWLDYILTKRKHLKVEEAKAKFHKNYERWQNEKNDILKRNKEREDEYKQAFEKTELEHKKRVEQWEKEKAAYLCSQEEANAEIDAHREAYSTGTENGVIDMIDIVLSSSQYPTCFPQEYSTSYNTNSKIAVIDYVLPSPEHLPTLKDVKYIQSRNEFKETYLTELAISKLYDDLLYKLTLRTIREIYDADTCKHVQAIVLNGWINSIDKATGKEFNACILSIQTNRDEFLEINLYLVEPKICFKKLKGVGSSKLFSLSPVAPILQINRDDARFVSSYAVADNLDESMNLAAMDWQDFEHLIRELFEKEFNQTGGEVKITRASRDGGVDAVVFDPDPIRGGKIVIQAKRYTNTVGLSAIRDLYGTVVNEGAIKGILVSTADYGPDAYSFAKDKPITLLDGGNLLHLLQRHGHKARIDLKEAKAILAEQQ